MFFGLFSTKSGGDSQAHAHALDSQLDRLKADEAVPEYARSLIDLLSRELRVLQQENGVLKRHLGPRYKRALRSAGMMEEETGPDVLMLFGIGIGLFVLLYLLRRYIKGAQFDEKVNARGKVAIVTGASSGIGKQVARELSHRHARVYMMCRDAEKGRAAVRELSTRYGCDSTQMIVMEGDLADFASVRRFVAAFDKEESALDILINNAGMMAHPRFEKTVDDHELVWQTNYLGHFLLTELLLPKLERSEAGGRIVNVSSKLHLHADGVDAEVVESKRHYGRWLKTYARSKLAQVMHAAALTKRIRARDPASRLVINSLHPGTVNTELGRLPLLQRLKRLFAPLVWFLLKTDRDGAQTPLHLALSKKIAGVSGKYFSDCAQADVHPLAKDEDACELLYNHSIEACGLDRTRY